MSQVFYRKWRPQNLAEVMGQEHVTRTLLNALATGRVAHAYLFCGPRGTGKTSTGRILAKAINCLESGQGEPCNHCAMCQAVTEGRAMDLIEVDAASNRGIDEIRDLREKVSFAPAQARRKVYIIDEVHMLTDQAFNALLKTLEEPPPHTVFVLATTETHKIPATILSRCQRFDFRRIPLSGVASRLGYICQQEGITVPPPALELIAKSAAGSLRDAENLLEQLVTFYGAELDLAQVQGFLGVTDDARIRELARHIVSKDVAAGLATISSVCRDGLDLGQFARGLLEYLRALLLIKAGTPEAVEQSSEAIAEMRPLAARASLRDLLQAVKLCSEARSRLEDNFPLPLELLVVECALEPEGAAPERAPSPQPVREAPKIVPPPAPEVTPVGAADKESPLEWLSHNWKRVQEVTRPRNKTAEALLRSCRPVEAKNGIVTLGFRHSILRDKLSETGNRQAVEEAISSLLGSPYRVQCVVDGQSSAPVNPLVKAAVDMGARIVDSS